MKRVLFVCLGNICRSPLGEGILRRMAADRGIEIEVDSAGTGDYHIGDLPDPRARAEGERRGYDMSMRARQVTPSDFKDFELIIAMDEANVSNLMKIPGADKSKIFLARSFDPTATTAHVADPYYGTEDDFKEVADQLEAACEKILDKIEP
ncbi:low molecular weight protein-tyrosine-phosphatase [soil metagenome]